MQNNDKKFKMWWIRHAFGLMNGDRVIPVFLAAALVGGLVASFFNLVEVVLLSVLGLFVLAFLAYLWMASKDEAIGQGEFINGWIASAPDESERDYRRSVLDEQGASAALAMASTEAMNTGGLSAPVVNVDGSLMIPGTVVDVNGNTYGVTPMETGRFHDDTGGFVSPSTSYHSPFGMDQ